ncbi:MAG: hypothetical protein EOO87_09085 [Pedobacter sp.]|nr:MAG: hypothetical protein EOO87_09085 [Pedobacter sp.]
MRQDNILEISIDDNDRLNIKPQKEKFALIYRSATEVHWDDKGLFLYSPKPREWTYLDWYKHIVSTIWTEYRCKLNLTNKTCWGLIPEDLKESIIAFEKTNWQEKLEGRN